VDLGHAVTVFVWDASSYDGVISLDAAKRARGEGIVAVVHRLTRQGGLIDPYAGRNLATFRQVGFELIGAYAVTYTSGGHQQDELTMRQADQVCPWWRTFPGWWWMEDLERWPTDNVPADLGIAVARELEAGSGRRCSLYASHSQYGDQLRAWTGPLVNADYTGRPAAGFRAMYPGDNWRPDHGSWNGGWSAYSGREPDLLQYTSSATVGGLTTCDVSAYRGTFDQLHQLLTGAPTAPASPDLAAPQEDTMFLATDGTQYYLCDGQVSRPVSLSAAQIIAYGKTSGYGPTFPQLVVGDPNHNPANAAHEWTDLPRAEGGVYAKYVRLGWGTWAGVIPAALAPIDVDALAEKIAADLIAAGATGLTAADHAGIVGDVKDALRAGTGSET
jgi:hypothetical protein